MESQRKHYVYNTYILVSIGLLIHQKANAGQNESQRVSGPNLRWGGSVGGFKLNPRINFNKAGLSARGPAAKATNDANECQDI